VPDETKVQQESPGPVAIEITGRHRLAIDIMDDFLRRLKGGEWGQGDSLEEAQFIDDLNDELFKLYR